MAEHFEHEGYYAEPDGPQPRNVDKPVETDAYGGKPGADSTDEADEKKTTHRAAKK